MKIDELFAISETLREMGEVPSGLLYSLLMGRMSLTQYEETIGTLKRAGLVAESNHVLRWVGPEVAS